MLSVYIVHHNTRICCVSMLYYVMWWGAILYIGKENVVKINLRETQTKTKQSEKTEHRTEVKICRKYKVFEDPISWTSCEYHGGGSVLRAGIAGLKFYLDDG